MIFQSTPNNILFFSFGVTQPIGYRKVGSFSAEFSTFGNEAFLRMQDEKDGTVRSGASRRSRSNSQSSHRKSRNRAPTGGQKTASSAPESAKASKSKPMAKVTRVPATMSASTTNSGGGSSAAHSTASMVKPMTASQTMTTGGPTKTAHSTASQSATATNQMSKPTAASEPRLSTSTSTVLISELATKLGGPDDHGSSGNIRTETGKLDDSLEGVSDFANTTGRGDGRTSFSFGSGNGNGIGETQAVTHIVE